MPLHRPRPTIRWILAASLLVAVPAATGAAEPGDGRAVVSRGEGPGVILLAGLLGGTARLEPLADSLVRDGFRVLAVDPYRLSVDAPDVSFAGLAREVALVAERHGVRDAVVVAHGHASGIAVRLAADEPGLVRHVVLLDAGLLRSTRSSGIARGLRVAAIVARVPGGTYLIRTQLLKGIRANSGTVAGLSDVVARAYADQLTTQLPEALRMARRLADAVEPKPMPDVLARVQVPIVALVGAAPHETAPPHEALDALRAHRTASVRLLTGVGHFVHEEAPREVVREVRAGHGRAVITSRRGSARS